MIEDIDFNVFMVGMCIILDVLVEVFFGVFDFFDFLQWNCFVFKMVKVFNIDIEVEDLLENERKLFIFL